MVVPPKHPKMIVFSRKTHGCWVPLFSETPVYRYKLYQVVIFALSFCSVHRILLSAGVIFLQAVYRTFSNLQSLHNNMAEQLCWDKKFDSTERLGAIELAGWDFQWHM